MTRLYPTLTTLPTEIILKIINYYVNQGETSADTRSLKPLLLVSHRLYDIVQPLYLNSLTVTTCGTESAAERHRSHAVCTTYQLPFLLRALYEKPSLRGYFRRLELCSIPQGRSWIVTKRRADPEEEKRLLGNLVAAVCPEATEVWERFIAALGVWGIDHQLQTLLLVHLLPNVEYLSVTPKNESFEFLCKHILVYFNSRLKRKLDVTWLITKGYSLNSWGHKLREMEYRWGDSSKGVPVVKPSVLYSAFAISPTLRKLVGIRCRTNSSYAPPYHCISQEEASWDTDMICAGITSDFSHIVGKSSVEDLTFEHSALDVTVLRRILTFPAQLKRLEYTTYNRATNDGMCPRGLNVVLNRTVQNTLEELVLRNYSTACHMCNTPWAEGEGNGEQNRVDLSNFVKLTKIESDYYWILRGPARSSVPLVDGLPASLEELVLYLSPTEDLNDEWVDWDINRSDTFTLKPGPWSIVNTIVDIEGVLRNTGEGGKLAKLTKASIWICCYYMAVQEAEAETERLIKAFQHMSQDLGMQLEVRERTEIPPKHNSYQMVGTLCVFTIPRLPHLWLK